MVARKKTQVLTEHGRLACEACNFEFGAAYGTLGEGFIECHHTLALSALEKERRTRLEDVALVCSNCHRMLHRRRPWLAAADLKMLLLAVTGV